MIEAPVAPAAVPAEPTTPIKPSEALRLGSLLVDGQTIGSLFSRVFEPNGSIADTHLKACARGAILLGWGFEPYRSILIDDPLWVRLGDFDRTGRFDCPDECARVAGAGRIAMHLNDEHRWPFSRIATWLEEHGQ